MRRARALLCTFAIPFLLACGASTEPTPALEERPDASPEPVTSEPPSPETPDASTVCETELTTAQVNEALLSAEPGTDHRVWVIRARNDEIFLTLTVRESAGATHGASTGTFGDEQRTPGMASVGLLVQTDCHEHGDHYHCGPSFIARTGTWSFTELDTQVGGAVNAQLSAELVEAKVTQSAATPVANGKTLCLRELSLQGTLVAP
jgi:hypothetical protein